jgi:predicted Zn-dependent peptidase
VFDLTGQCVIEASTSAAQLQECVTEVARLLARQAERIDPADVERARNQIAVRQMRTHERAVRRLEAAVQDLFVFDRVRPRAELLAGTDAVTPEQVRQTFERMLAARPAVAVAGKVSAGTNDRIEALVSAATA